MTKPYDKAGQEISVGDYIVYGHALGRCAGLRFGRVLAINGKKLDHRDRPKHHFTVRSIDDDWEGEPPKLNAKKGTLQFAERILVIDPKILPDIIRTQLEKIPELDPTRDPLYCQDCETIQKTTTTTNCPYSEDVNGEIVEIQVCDTCYHERAMYI